MTADPRPIGIFDSGLGGLSVLRVLQERFPQESFLYLGDTARLPYGSKSPATIRKYSEQNLRLLTDRGVKALVVACNSASTQMVESTWEGIPLYNTILPGAKAALAVSPGARIGLIGTRATVQSGAYDEALKNLNPAAQLFSMPCPLLVPLAEEGWDGDPVANLIVYRYLQPLLQHQIETLILGCTHYPLLMGSISRVTGSAVQLVDSGEAITEQMKADINETRWGAATSEHPKTQLLVTDKATAFQEMARRILGPACSEPELVNL